MPSVDGNSEGVALAVKEGVSPTTTAPLKVSAVDSALLIDIVVDAASVTPRTRLTVDADSEQVAFAVTNDNNETDTPLATSDTGRLYIDIA